MVQNYICTGIRNYKIRTKPLESPEEANVKIPLRELPQLLAYKRKNSDEDIITIK